MTRGMLICTAAMGVGFLSGCHVVDRDRHSYETGRALSTSESNSIEVGRTTSNELIERFGAPTSRSDRPDGTGTWQWCATTTNTSSGHVLLLWDRRSTKTSTQCTTVEIANGVVTAIHRQ
ncbi:MAG: hypothetical protein ACOYN0_04615 [Phycisphaerales bacterium]